MAGAVRVKLSDIAVGPRHNHGRCPRCKHTVVGPPITGASQTFIDRCRAVRIGDHGVHALCCGLNHWIALQNLVDHQVNVEGSPIFCTGDITLHCFISLGMQVRGSKDVRVGEGGAG
jgi:hypothetical protein